MRYVLRVWLIQILGAFVFVLLGNSLQSLLGDEREGIHALLDISFSNLGAIWFLIAVIAPAIETVLLWFGLMVIRMFTKDQIIAAIISGIVWGALHGFQNNIANGFSAGWSFFIMGVALQVGAAQSRWLGLLIAFTLHFLLNSFAVLMLFFVALAT